MRDTGPGISAADQAKLFQEFQQAENPRTRKKEGTGLGLAISKRIIEMHGGQIWIKSQVGQDRPFSSRCPCRCKSKPRCHQTRSRYREVGVPVRWLSAASCSVVTSWDSSRSCRYA